MPDTGKTSCVGGLSKDGNVPILIWFQASILDERPPDVSMVIICPVDQTWQVIPDTDPNS